MYEPIDDQVLDLLVDGELTSDRERSLLQKLEQEPGAWRRCALAFLEAQRWRRDMGLFSKRPEMPTAAVASQAIVNQTATVSRPLPWWSTRVTGTLLAMAASFLVAFGLGVGIDRFRNDDPRNDDPRRGKLDAPSNAVVTTTKQQNSKDPLKAVTLVTNDGGARSQVQVPVVEAMPDQNWLQSGPNGLPADLRRMLERQGHQVKQQRQIVPFQLEDGRQGYVPMDRVEITPVGNRSFQ
jgi:hypothetical protein